MVFKLIDKSINIKINDYDSNFKIYDKDTKFSLKMINVPRYRLLSEFFPQNLSALFDDILEDMFIEIIE